MAIRIVTISMIKPSGQPETLSIAPPQISTKGRNYYDEVLWKTAGSRISSFNIDFNYPAAGSPFPWSSQNSVNGKLQSGVPNVPGPVPTHYPYTITVQVKAKGKKPAYQIVIDPEVIVDDVTPPPKPTSSGKKKAAKKKAAKKKAAKKKGAKKRK